MKKNSVLSMIDILLIFLFLYAPIFIILIFSFNASSSTYVLDGFSTRWYKVLFEDLNARNALKNTVILA
ncbi:MAG: ABC transporter permease, partial [Eubacterium sp.]|nr:ABC transporter permease [Eubacterium sp.]